MDEQALAPVEETDGGKIEIRIDMNRLTIGEVSELSGNAPLHKVVELMAKAVVNVDIRTLSWPMIAELRNRFQESIQRTLASKN